MPVAVIRRYERLLRIGKGEARWDVLRARAVYCVAFTIILIQLINLMGLLSLHDSWTPDHTVAAVLIPLMAAIPHGLRYSRSFVLFGIAFCGILVAGAGAAASWDGSGINTALLPFLVMGPLIPAFVTGWRASFAFLFAALIALAWLYLVSVADPFASGVPATGREFQRLLQAVCAALLGTLISCFLSYNAETSLRRAERAERRARRAANRARRAEAAKSHFLANMSHELRTPLNGVIGLTDSLLRADLGDKERALAKTVKDSGEGLLVILNDLLDLSKIEAGKIVIEPRPTDIAALCRGVAETWAESAVARGITIKAMTVEPVPAFLALDDFRLRQILNNLVSNALKFTESGTITLELAFGREPGQERGEEESQEGGEGLVTIRVVDTGIGVPSSQHETIFAPFEQAETGTARRYGGTGLGLPICRRLAGAMGGGVELEWSGPEGSCFRLHLPGSVARAPDCEAGAGDEAAALAGLRVLAAEDNAVNRLVLAEFLGQMQISVIFAEDGAECLTALDMHEVDLLLLDRHMPNMGGEEVAARLRAGPPPLCHLPIVAVTADAMSGEREALLASGMDEVVAKPVRPAALAAAMTAALAARRAKAQGLARPQ